MSDLDLMFDMFPIGQMALVSETDDMYVRTKKRWKPVRLFVTLTSIAWKQSSPLSYIK